jgi:hypothetical protein
MVPEPEQIVVGGLPVSPLQYRYLFPDLAGLPDAEEAITHHYVMAGRHEIEAGQRAAHHERIAAVRLQRLAPGGLAAAAPSPNWRLEPGSTGTLDVLLSHGAVEEGAFEPSPAATLSPHWRLYLKGEFHGFYQRGIPGLTQSIDETASWIEQVVRAVKPTRLRFLGFGSAGYAAILLGHLLAADVVYAFAPEIVLGIPQYRSARCYRPGFHPLYSDIRPLLRGLGDRVAIVYPAYDPAGFRMLQFVREAGVENVALGVDFHPGGLAVPLDVAMLAEETPPPARRLTRIEHPGTYTDVALERIAAAYEAGADGDLARSEPLLRAALADDPRNYGFMCHLAAQRGLQGDPEGAERFIRPALSGMIADYGAFGLEVARHARSVPGGYHAAAGDQLGAIQSLFDRLHAEVTGAAAQTMGETA